MKELELLRHAKSDWLAEFREDHDRPLSPRGVKAARLMGRFLSGADLVPRRVFSSSAERAVRTAELAARAGGWECPIETSRTLYLPDPDSLFKYLRGIDEEQDRILLVGHNPSLEEFLSLLVGGGTFRLPTASLAMVTLTLSTWSECRPGTGVLQWLVRPKLLAGLGLEE
jgi:phosphohistidine phosphatase